MNILIQSHTEKDEETGETLYWNNLHGWVEIESANYFTEEETKSLTLPIGGRWVVFHSNGEISNL